MLLMKTADVFRTERAAEKGRRPAGQKQIKDRNRRAIPA